jgi:hypothetical protein
MSIFVRRKTTALALAGTLCATVVMTLATNANAYTKTWYWWSSSTSQECWSNTNAPPSSNSESCVSPGANFFRSYNGQATYIPKGYLGGVFSDVDGTEGNSGEYCNSYPQTFNTYLDAPSDYYYGIKTNDSYCYVNGDNWGTNVVNNVAGPPPYANPGAQHFASVQSVDAMPFSSAFGGSNAELYVNTTFAVSSNSDTSAWGYLCADFVDQTGQGNTLEICGVKWNWGGKVGSSHVMACGNLSGAFPSEKPVALPTNLFGSDNTYITKFGQSATTSTSKTFTTAKPYSMVITWTNMTNAVRDAMVPGKLGCTNGGTHSWSTNPANYRLMGVEDGVELNDATQGHGVNAEEQGLVVADLY